MEYTEDNDYMEEEDDCMEEDTVFYEKTVYPEENLPKAGIEITEEHRMISLAKEFGIIGYNSDGLQDETYISFRRIRHALNYGKMLLEMGKMSRDEFEQDSANRMNRLSQFSVFHLNSLQEVLFDYSKTRIDGIKMLVIRYHDKTVLIQDPVRLFIDYDV